MNSLTDTHPHVDRALYPSVVGIGFGVKFSVPNRLSELRLELPGKNCFHKILPLPKSPFINIYQQIQ